VTFKAPRAATAWDPKKLLRFKSAGVGTREETSVKAFWEGKKYGHQETTAVPAAFHAAVRALVKQRLLESGNDWASFVFGSSYDLITQKDFERIESDLLASGYRFDVSAVVSAKEAPEKYKHLRRQDEYEIATEAVNGKLKVGHGDNVVKYPQNVVGVARYVHTADDVMDLMINGVPADTIAIIDDSGGTLTAPILESFKAVVCLGGTVRSHLGILTREFGIPCLMNAKISGIKTGDRLELNTSASAKTAQDYQTGVEKPADVWKLV
jgi:PEP-utilising enzyme, mobile domain